MTDWYAGSQVGMGNEIEFVECVFLLSLFFSGECVVFISIWYDGR